MKAMPVLGVLLLILGALAFVIPVPQRDDHSVRIGDAKITVQTENREKLPPAVGIILIGGGAVVGPIIAIVGLVLVVFGVRARKA